VEIIYWTNGPRQKWRHLSRSKIWNFAWQGHYPIPPTVRSRRVPAWHNIPAFLIWPPAVLDPPPAVFEQFEHCARLTNMCGSIGPAGSRSPESVKWFSVVRLWVRYGVQYLLNYQCSFNHLMKWLAKLLSTSFNFYMSFPWFSIMYYEKFITYVFGRGSETYRSQFDMSPTTVLPQ